MTTDQAQTQTATHIGQGAPTVFAVFFIAVHFICLIQFFAPATSARDANSYYAQARLIATTGKPYVDTESIVQFVGFHWAHVGGNRYFSKYPPGLPVILAAAYRLLGPEAMLWLNPLMASLALFAIFLVCRQWMGPGWGLVAMALMAINPLANKHALYGDAHTVGTFFLVWALFMVTEWTRTRKPLLLIAAGLLAGFIPAIRYSEVLFLPAFAAYAMLVSRDRKDAARNMLLFAAGAIVPLAALCFHNHVAFGAFWKTGYASEAAEFGWAYFKQAFPAYPQRMLAEGGAYVFVLGIFGVTALCAHRKHWKQGALLAGLIIPVTLMYMLFFVAPFAPVRYLLPTIPLYVIGAVWFLKLLAGDHRATAVVTASVILLATAYWGLPASRQELESLEKRHMGLTMVTYMLQAHVPRGSIVVADEGICQQLDNFGYWRLAEESVLLRRGRPPRAPTGTHESQQEVSDRHAVQRERYAKLPRPQLLAAFEDDVRTWAGGDREVYWVATEKHMLWFTGGDPQNRGLIPYRVLRIPLPARRPRAHVPTHASGEARDPRFHPTRPGSVLVLYRWVSK